MGVKTVRLDADSERLLDGLVRETGLSISAVLKQGLLALRETRHAAGSKVYEVYERMDLGPGGYALAPSTQTRRGVEEVLRRRPR